MRILVAIAFALPVGLAAQVPQAVLDTTVLRIGEQATLTLRLDRSTGAAAVQWPVVGDTLMRHVEVVRRSAVDTIRVEEPQEAQAYQLVQQLIITSFDSGFWAIPPFLFTIDGRALGTEAMLLEVRSMELDSAGAVRDIRDIIEPPFNIVYWMQDHGWWVGGSLALAVLASLLWLYSRTRAKDPAEAVDPINIIPLHERVLSDLRALEAERVWQQGLHKAYHSRLTDLLRGYIEERYQVPALERTTDELLHELRVSPLTGDQQTQLANMLRLADMVKFAKANPTPAENEQMMAAAIRFVQHTATTNPTGTKPSAHAQ